jgi:hypothetical protein
MRVCKGLQAQSHSLEGAPRRGNKPLNKIPVLLDTNTGILYIEVMKKRTAVDEVMDEPIRLPGCPQVIVTRGWAYSWLKRLGYETDTRKGPFATVDYMVFGGSRLRPVDEPLTDMTQPWVVALIAQMEADAK